MRVLDQHLTATPKDWSALYLTEAKAGRERALADQQKAQAARVPGTSPTLPLDRYPATYADSMYGEIKVVKEGEGLTMMFGPEFTGDLKHWHYDTFEVGLAQQGAGAGDGVVPHRQPRPGECARDSGTRDVRSRSGDGGRDGDRNSVEHRAQDTGHRTQQDNSQGRQPKHEATVTKLNRHASPESFALCSLPCALPRKPQDRAADRRRWLDSTQRTTDDPRRVPLPPRAAGGATIVLRGGRVFDGTGAAAREGTVVITGDRIASVLAPGATSWPADARVIDVTGKTVMPGLIDMHTHLTYTERGLRPT